MSVYVKTLTIKDNLGRLPVSSSPSWLLDGADWTQTVLSEARSASAAFRCSVQFTLHFTHSFHGPHVYISRGNSSSGAPSEPREGLTSAEWGYY